MRLGVTPATRRAAAGRGPLAALEPVPVPPLVLFSRASAARESIVPRVDLLGGADWTAAETDVGRIMGR